MSEISIATSTLFNWKHVFVTIQQQQQQERLIRRSVFMNYIKGL